MDFGVTGKLGGYYLAEQYRKNAAAKAAGTGNFAGGGTKSRGRKECGRKIQLISMGGGHGSP